MFSAWKCGYSVSLNGLKVRNWGVERKVTLYEHFKVKDTGIVQFK